MNTRIEGPFAAQSAPGLGAGFAESLRTQAGRMAGQSVEVMKGTPSVLGSAAEEVAMLFSEKAEKKHHEERVVKGGGSPSLATAQSVSAYLERAHKEKSPQELQQLVDAMLKNGAENCQALVRGHPRFQQPTEQFLLFQMARQQAAQQGLPQPTIERLDAALLDLDAFYGDVIHAQLLTVEPAAAYAETATEVRSFQDSVHTVLGAPTMQQAMQELLALAGKSGQKLDTALNNLMKALGACLGTGLALQEALLESVVKDLFHLKTMNTVLDECRALVKVLERKQRDGEREQSRQQKHKPEASEPADGERRATRSAASQPSPVSTGLAPRTAREGEVHGPGR